MKVRSGIAQLHAVLKAWQTSSFKTPIIVSMLLWMKEWPCRADIIVILFFTGSVATNKDVICCAFNIISKFGKIDRTWLKIGNYENAFGEFQSEQDYVGWDYPKNNQINWSEKLEKIKILFTKMGKQASNIRWQIQSDKRSGITTNHPIYLLYMSQNGLNRMFYKFFHWKVARLKAIKKQNDGGLGMVDLESLFSSFKAA